MKKKVLKMGLEVDVGIARAIGNLTFNTTETDAVFLLLAHLPGFKKDEIEVQFDKVKMEITVGGGGQVESFEFVNVDRLVNIDRVVEMERFCKVFSIPDGIVFERIDATFDEEEEILLILIPKLEREVVQTEEEEVSCDVDKEIFIEERADPIPIPLQPIEPHDWDENLKPTEEFNSNEGAGRELEEEEEISSKWMPDQLEERGKESDGEEIPSEEIPDQMPNLPDSVENVELERSDPRQEQDSDSETIDPHQEHPLPDPKTPVNAPEIERIAPRYDQESVVREQETPDLKKPDRASEVVSDDQETLESEGEPDQSFMEEDGILTVEKAGSIKLPEDNADLDSIQKQEELETTQNPLAEGSGRNYEDEDGNHDVGAEDPLLREKDANSNLVEEEREAQERESAQYPISEESDEKLKEEDGNPCFEAEDLPPEVPKEIGSPEIDMNFDFIKEREEQDPENTRNPKSKESDSKCKDENPTIGNEHPPRQTPELIKLPETDTSFSLIEEQEEQEPEITQNHELENATIEAENPLPKTPEPIKFPEINTDFDLVGKQEMQESETIQNPRSEDTDQNFKQEDDTPSVQDSPPKTSEPIKLREIDTKFNPTQEQEEQEPESNQSMESKEPDQNFNQEDEDSDETGMMREREPRRVSKRSSAFPLNATSLLAGSAFLFSLVVLVFHFLRGRKQRSRS